MKLVNCSLNHFIEFIKGKTLVCFGAGKALQKFVEFCKQNSINLEDYVSYVCDNDPLKWGKRVCLGEKNIPIISIAKLPDINDLTVLITCQEACTVYTQLDQYEKWKNNYCFVYGYIESETKEVLEQNRWYPSGFRLCSEQKIPKKIHYCWFGSNTIPEQNKKWIESWHQYCPDYEIIEWNEHNYDIAKNLYMQQAYKAGKWGFVSDYARLDIIYNYGGIYLDTDVELLKNLDDLLYQDAFAGIENSGEINLGLGFGSVPYNELIKALRDIYSDLAFINKDGELNLTPIPALEKPFFNAKGYVNNGEYQIVEGMTIYPQKVLSPKDNYTGRICATNATYAIHHYDGSWTSDAKKKNKDEIRKLFHSVEHWIGNELDK